jgi:hypothetical protein
MNYPYFLVSIESTHSLHQHKDVSNPTDFKVLIKDILFTIDRLDRIYSSF